MIDFEVLTEKIIEALECGQIFKGTRNHKILLVEAALRTAFDEGFKAGEEAQKRKSNMSLSWNWLEERGNSE